MIKKAIINLIKNNDNIVIIDGGYNVGAWSNIILDQCIVDIIAYEASYSTFMENINKTHKNVKLIYKGLSDINELIYVNKDNNVNNVSYSIHDFILNGCHIIAFPI